MPSTKVYAIAMCIYLKYKKAQVPVFLIKDKCMSALFTMSLCRV